MLTHFTVVYDACVLYPSTLRSLLMFLAMADLYRARWTADIHTEWMRTLAENRPDIPEQKIERIRELMDSHVRDALVTDYEDLIPSLSLPDPGDRHVLAAAIRCSADVIVTYNLKDFPEESLSKWGVEAVHPDDFIHAQFDIAPEIVCGSVREHRSSLNNPPFTVDEYMESLLRQSLPQTVSELRRYAALL